jgi:hypothetical protein
MEGIQVSMKRIVVELRDVYWNFYNQFQLRLKMRSKRNFIMLLLFALTIILSACGI